MAANGATPVTPPAETPVVAAPTPIQSADPLSFVDDAPAFSVETIAILGTPADPNLVETRKASKDSDRELSFIPWVHYQAILFKAFGPGGYRLVPRAVPRQEGNVVTYLGALFVRPPGERKFQFIKEAKGECGLHGGMTAGNAAEGAQSDCLVKCCKGLGIFMELFDPAWRAAWERNYKGAYEARKRKAAWPAARPAAAAAPSAAAPAASPGSTTPEPTRPAPDATAPAAPDDGIAASPEQLDAIAARLKELTWKRGQVRLWFNEHFGITAQDPVRILGALSEQQANAAFTLLSAHGTGAYAALLAGLKAKGACA